MDAVKFLKERARMCEANQTGEMNCENCAAYKGVSQCYKLGEPEDPEKMVSIVEQWAKEHPAKTRQSEFLEHYPEAAIEKDGVVAICPLAISAAHRHGKGACNKGSSDTCSDCRREFWFAEVE